VGLVPAGAARKNRKAAQGSARRVRTALLGRTVRYLNAPLVEGGGRHIADFEAREITLVRVAVRNGDLCIRLNDYPIAALFKDTVIDRKSVDVGRVNAVLVVRVTEGKSRRVTHPRDVDV
jgi:hypothetical protein